MLKVMITSELLDPQNLKKIYHFDALTIPTLFSAENTKL